MREDNIIAAVEAYRSSGSKQGAADRLGWSRSKVRRHLERAAERGLLGPQEALPGYAIKSVTHTPRGAYVRQVKAHGEKWDDPEGHVVSGVSALVDAEGRVIQRWVKTRAEDEDRETRLRAVVKALLDDLPRAVVVPTVPLRKRHDLLNLYVLTDAHIGMLSWHEETGADYDIEIAERLLADWFAAAVDMAPRAGTAVLAQLGDLMHHDGWESKTPSSGHVLDADSRLQKMIRVAIRILRRAIAMLLEKHDRVHVVAADANHDPAAGAWMREMLAAFYDQEPRVTVDRSAGTYYVYEHGDVSLYFHHGHKRNIGNVDSVFAGRFREVYGRTRFSYAHLGHLHSDELKSTNLMKVERHETLAAPDAYAANGGWLSGRSAKVITYHTNHGEVSRIVLTPEMVDGWGANVGAVNDNLPVRRAA